MSKKYTKFWDGSKRPIWDKNGVKITVESFTHRRVLSAERGQKRRRLSDELELGERPTLVNGLILPVTTTGRKTAPEPLCGLDLRFYPYDKGHIMALELGGPDVDANIFPQWRSLNQHDKWRKMEREVKRKAEKIFNIEKTREPSKWTGFDAPGLALWIKFNLSYGRHPCVPNFIRISVWAFYLEQNVSKPIYDYKFENMFTGIDVPTAEPTGDFKIAPAAEEKARKKLLKLLRRRQEKKMKRKRDS